MLIINVISILAVGMHLPNLDGCSVVYSNSWFIKFRCLCSLFVTSVSESRLESLLSEHYVSLRLLL